MWRLSQLYCGLNTLTQLSVEPLQRLVDQLVEGTRWARFFTKLDLVKAYTQFGFGRRTST